MFVKREESGVLSAISVVPEGNVTEFLEDGSPELVTFMSKNKLTAHEYLERSDLEMARVMEDVVNVLINKGIIQLTDLPIEAQKKLFSRRKVRGQVQSVDLLDEDFNLDLD